MTDYRFGIKRLPETGSFSIKLKSKFGLKPLEPLVARPIEEVFFTHTWSFSESGFIDGGQNGAVRQYIDPDSVLNSPWSVLDNGFGLRLDFEDDYNCRFHNPNTQSATAVAEIITSKKKTMTVTWSGLGETQDATYDVMRLFLDSVPIGSAHSVGGGLGCAGGMAPVVSDPPPPQQVVLQAGTHVLKIETSTNDSQYHFGSYYQFNLSFTDMGE